MPDGSHYAIQDTAQADAERRVLIAKAIDRIEHAQMHTQWCLSARDYMGQAASLLEQAGETVFAERVEEMTPFGGDLVTLLRAIRETL